MLAVLGSAVAIHGQPKHSNPSEALKNYPYHAAFIANTGGFPPRMEVVVFPFVGKAFRIPIWPARGLTFSPDGKAIYDVCNRYSDPPVERALCKIDLTTLETATVAGSSGLNAAYLAVSNREDHFLAFGVYRTDGNLGLLHLTASDGAVSRVFAESEPPPGSEWRHLSLSPDGKRAVATRAGRVELIQVANGAIEYLGEEFFIAAWSPDGKWLAALEKGEHGRTILFDATTMTRKRVLGNSELDWSPDSRYLLGMKEHDRCGPYNTTLQAINVETGERTTIKSSECQVYMATTGWVSRDVRAR